MDLNELYRRLAVGELSNLAMATEGAGSIVENQHQKIVLYANDALLRLHTRFLLKENDLLMEQVGYLTHYPLLKKFAWSQNDPDVDEDHTFYIQDQFGKPFLQDVVKILEVWDIGGNKIPLNDSSDPTSFFTPTPNVLQIPKPMNGVPLSILYQAGHAELSHTDPTQTIDLPEFLHSALTAFIAHKVFSHMNTQESTVKAAEHLGQFDTICLEAVQQALVSTGTSTSGVRFEKRGWI